MNNKRNSALSTEQNENPLFLTTQIITYLGNKRSLIGKIEQEVQEISQKLNKEKMICADIFSGSGIVARMLKSHSSLLIANDLENYSFTINSCYLSNKNDFPAFTRIKPTQLFPSKNKHLHQ